MTFISFCIALLAGSLIGLFLRFLPYIEEKFEDRSDWVVEPEA